MNRYLGLEVQADRALHVAWLLDFAELPSLEQLDALDADHDGAVTPAEQQRYLDAMLAAARPHWSLELDGARVEPEVAARAVEVPQGSDGRPTVRVLVELRAPLPAGRREVRVRVVDTFLRERAGWREVRAEDSATARVSRSDLAPVERYREGVTPPTRMPRVDSAEVQYTLAAPSTPMSEREGMRARSAGARWWGAGALLAAALAVLGLGYARGRRG